MGIMSSMSDRRDPSAPEKAAGQILKSIRTEKGLAPTVVAYRLGMSEQNWLRYESGRNQMSWLQIGEFAWALEEDPRALFDRLAPYFRSREHAPEVAPKDARLDPKSSDNVRAYITPVSGLAFAG